MQANSTRATATERLLAALREVVTRDDPDSDPLGWYGHGPSAHVIKIDLNSQLSGVAPATETTARVSIHLISAAVRAEDQEGALTKAGRLYDSFLSRLSRDATLGGEVVRWELSGELGMGELNGSPVGMVDCLLTLATYAG